MGSDRAVDAYYEEVRGVELLNPVLERELFLQYRTCSQCAREYTEGALQKTCPRCNTARNFRARERLIEGALRFVVKVAREYARRAKGERHGEELLLALISAGNLGLLVAIDRFNMQVGTRFLTYAAWWVREKILEELDAMGVVRVPAYQQKAQRARWKQSGGEPEAPLVTLEPLTTLEQTAGDTTTEVALLNKYGARALGVLLRREGVSTRDQYALLLHLGAREDPKTLKQISARTGYTPDRVKEVRTATLETLRSALFDLELGDSSDFFV